MSTNLLDRAKILLQIVSAGGFQVKTARERGDTCVAAAPASRMVLCMLRGSPAALLVIPCCSAMVSDVLVVWRG